MQEINFHVLLPMDMWVPYLEFTYVAAPQALIVHDDKFHCAKELNKAVDLVRRREHGGLKAQGEETLTKTRYLWLKNPLNWTDRQRERFQTLEVDALKVSRAWAHYGGVFRLLGLPVYHTDPQLKLAPIG